MADNSLTLRERIGLRNGDIKLTPQIIKKMNTGNIWKNIEKFFFDWRTELRSEISVVIYNDEIEGIKIELKSGDENLTTTTFGSICQSEVEDLMNSILSKAIYEGMNVKMDTAKNGTNELVIWY